MSGNGAKIGILYWKLALWKLISGVIITIGSGWIAATAAVKWESMSNDERIIIMLTLGMSVVKFCDGFFDQTVSRLLAGKPPVSVAAPISSGDTQIITKTETVIKEPVK